MNNGVTQQPDLMQASFPGMSDPNAVSLSSDQFRNPLCANVLQFDLNSFEFANNGPDVLQDFDFDSFLHQDGEGVDNFGFDTSGFLEDGGIGAE
jgi:hypothetical protein